MNPRTLNNPCNTDAKLKAGTGPYQHSLSNMEDNKKLITGAQQILIEKEILVFPNPFNNYTMIRFHNPEFDPFKLIITDLAGKRVLIISNIRNDHYKLECAELNPGIYLLELQGTKNYRSKIVIR